MARNWMRFADPNRDYTQSAAELALACKLAEADCLRFETQKQFCLQQTTPDFYFADVNLAVYLDGEQVHRNREDKDKELSDKLAKRWRCTVRRIVYRAPLTKSRRAEIVAQILDDHQGLRRMQR